MKGIKSCSIFLSLLLQGRVVRKLVNANLRLKVNKVFISLFKSDFKALFQAKCKVKSKSKLRAKTLFGRIFID